MELCNPGTIRALLEEAGIRLKKEYGQNFLVNPAIPARIAEECADEKESLILEIGPGIGCLTQELAKRYAAVAAVEIDRGLIPILAKTLAGYPNVTVENADVMKLDLAAFLAERADGRPVSVCANLPYYITTPVLMRLLESGIPFRTVTVMVQAEVVDRLTAAPGSADYGAITAVLGFYGRANRLFTVAAGNFMPPPKVNSAVVRIDLYEDPPYRPQNRNLFFGLIKAAFAMRRKTLVNAISAKYPLGKQEIAEVLVSCGFPADIRGERLSTADFCLLSDKLAEKMV